MANLKDIRTRIVSVKNTETITTAMKLVAASKLRRAQVALEEARPYSKKLKAIVSNLSQTTDKDAHPLLRSRKGGKALVLFISSDKGLCGGLNNILAKEFLNFQDQIKSELASVSMIAFGKKGAEYFKNRPIEIKEIYRNLREKGQKIQIILTIQKLVTQYIQGETDRVYIAFNDFKTVLTQTPMFQQILPIEAPEAVKNRTEYIFEPSSEKILEFLLPKYVENQAYTALLSNFASEHGSRMTAMDSASKNAADLISKFQLQYNRLRQAVITTELIEIISGAESIN